MTTSPEALHAGAAEVDITPETPQFLYGYPHVERFSTGVHDPLFSSALYLGNAQTCLLLISNDVIFVGKALGTRVRRRISQATGIPFGQILVSATHTHSGPITLSYLSNEGDPVVPRPDAGYLRQLEEGMVAAGVRAFQQAEAAEAGWGRASGCGLGTHRRDPRGPADPEIPVLLVRSALDGRALGCMLVCAMHPTVLHEDSTLVSCDFPGLARRHLQQQVLGGGCPIIYHMGASGNQSPRHVTRANTFEEAGRLGTLLGVAVEQALARIQFETPFPLACARTELELTPARFPALEAAEEKLRRARARLEGLRDGGAPRQEVRTAECDVFGAEETVTLARAAIEGRLDAARHAVMPAEIQVFTLGSVLLAGWPGEVFVEYALELRAKHPNLFVVTLANSDLQGYIVTPEAEREGGYEASNAVFSASSGAQLVAATLRLLQAGPEKADKT